MKKPSKKRKKDLVDCVLFGIYFFLRFRTVATAIAIMMTTTPITKYMSMSELETDDDVPEVGAAVGDAAEATVAPVCA
jgi:hypothetical protein